MSAVLSAPPPMDFHGYTAHYTVMPDIAPHVNHKEDLLLPLPFQATQGRHLDRAITSLSRAPASRSRGDAIQVENIISQIALFRILRRELRVPSNRACQGAFTQLLEVTDGLDSLGTHIVQLPPTAQLALTVFHLVGWVEGQMVREDFEMMFTNQDITSTNGVGVETAIKQIALFRLTEGERASALGTNSESFWDGQLEEHRNRIILWMADSRSLPKSVAWILDLFSLVLQAEDRIERASAKSS